LDPTVSLLRPGETVVTNDEVACLFQLGRVDFWYAESQMDVDRYRLNTATGPRGTYTGAHVLTDVNSTREQVANCASGRGCLLAVFRTGRFPFQAFEALMSEIETEFGGVVIRRAAALTLLRVSAPGLANDRQ
jgi:hypothetical protein